MSNKFIQTSYVTAMLRREGGEAAAHTPMLCLLLLLPDCDYGNCSMEGGEPHVINRYTQ